MSINNIRKIRKANPHNSPLQPINLPVELTRSGVLESKARKTRRQDVRLNLKKIDKQVNAVSVIVQSDRTHRRGVSEALRPSYEAFINQKIFQHGVQIPDNLHGRKRPGVVSSLAGSKNLEEDDFVLDLRGWQPIFEVPRGSFSESKPVKESFTMDFVVGKGGFGKVWRVRERKTGKLYAMKQMLKSRVVAKKSVSSIMNEIELLSRLRHPFLINMSYAFQDRFTLYLALDYLNGGDLRYHITRQHSFSESDCRFLICNILLALQHLHSHNIIHRDIKPQNLVFSRDGYLHLTDLGISRESAPNNGSDTSGTPGYMSPEVITRNDHTFTADFFAVGVIAYELMMGRRPYTGRSRQEIREKILAKQVRVGAVPNGWSQEAADFVNRLIQRRPQERLGATGGVKEVKGHAWLKRVDWRGIESKTIKAPFIPQTVEQDYATYQNINISSDSTLNSLQNQTQLLVKNAAVQQLFRGYQYNIDQRATPPRISASVKPVAFAHRNREYISARNN